jgi:hypothetical protein
MAASEQSNPRVDAELMAARMKEHSRFLEWDREISGKLYYALWIVFMGGFVLSITSTVALPASSSCTLWLLRTFRLFAVVGSLLNFLLQSKAIDAVRFSREKSAEYELHIALEEKNPDKSQAAYMRAAGLTGKLNDLDGLIPRLECALICCAIAFLTLAIWLTWDVMPTTR